MQPAHKSRTAKQTRSISTECYHFLPLLSPRSSLKQTNLWIYFHARIRFRGNLGIKQIRNYNLRMDVARIEFREGESRYRFVFPSFSWSDRNGYGARKIRPFVGFYGSRVVFRKRSRTIVRLLPHGDTHTSSHKNTRTLLLSLYILYYYYPDR